MSIHRIAIATLMALGMIGLTGSSAVALELGDCNPEEDPNSCQCPSNLAGYESCNVTSLDSLLHFDDPSAVDTSFISTSYDSEDDNYDVVIDLRQVNGGGLIPKLQNDGQWNSIAELKSYIAELTGVPATEDHRLTPFDMTQIGYSTAVTDEGFAGTQFNDVILDLITDQYGIIHIDDVSIDVARLEEHNRSGWQDEDELYLYDGELAVDQTCTTGQTSVSGEIYEVEQCSFVEAKDLYRQGPLPKPLGSYNVGTSISDLEVNGEGSYRVLLPDPNGGIRVRTLFVMADLSIYSDAYWEYQGTIDRHVYAPFIAPAAQQTLYAPALVQKESRVQQRGEAYTPGAVLDGICSHPGRTTFNPSTTNHTLQLITGAGTLPKTSVCRP